MNQSILDLVFLSIVVLFAVLGVVRGFIKELFARGAPVLGLWAAVLLYRRVNEFFEPYIKIHILSLIVSFLMVFIVVYIILMIVRNIVSGIFGGEILKGLDRILGFAFGIVEGLALVALLLILLQAQPWFDVSELLEQSFFYRMLRWAVAAVPAAQEIPLSAQGSGDAA